ncbi:hypothetical protein [Rhodococcus sp. IEGM 1318]|uniref:hypothetical protein n=1 Tax=Rhodococcus sp. IEGM 1318 TaxID=3082226 RepID=UPI00295491AB|nr:hypothetical protein [Rhodococcus sp. IEGM 1318]MDV8003623.1 hypothetical protein [Rhodococcus sp. IEGM 1318]
MSDTEINETIRRAAARLLIHDNGRRSAELAETAAEYAARADRIIKTAANGDTLEELLRAVLDVLAESDSATATLRAAQRAIMAEYADGDNLLDEVLGRRPGGDQ